MNLKEKPIEEKPDVSEEIPQGKPGDKKFFSGKTGKFLRGAALAGILVAGQEAVTPFVRTQEAEGQVKEELSEREKYNKEEKRRNEEVAGWLKEIGFESIEIGHDRRASSVRGEAYHIKFKTQDGEHRIFLINPDGKFEKKHLQIQAKNALQEAFDKKAFVERIEIDSDAKNVMQKTGVSISEFILKVRPEVTRIDLYQDGKNHSVTIRKDGSDGLLLTITDKTGKSRRYTIRNGSVVDGDKHLGVLD